MGTIREALLRNGVFYYSGDGGNYTLEDGFGAYMVARDSRGVARFRIESSELHNYLVVRDIASGLVVQTIS